MDNFSGAGDDWSRFHCLESARRRWDLRWILIQAVVMSKHITVNTDRTRACLSPCLELDNGINLYMTIWHRHCVYWDEVCNTSRQHPHGWTISTSLVLVLVTYIMVDVINCWMARRFPWHEGWWTDWGKWALHGSCVGRKFDEQQHAIEKWAMLRRDKTKPPRMNLGRHYLHFSKLDCSLLKE